MIEHDLVIRNGTLADGTGGAPYVADIAVRDGLIVSVGKVAGGGREEIDATGLLVAPGFVDIHTHYDGQAVWTGRLAPSSLHGVTTVVMGNCGVGFAPVHEKDHERLVELMEGVEDLPGAVLHEGLTWNWESFGEYLDVLATKEYDLDVAAQLPHAPLRVYVMGERACQLDVATESDVAKMRAIAADAARAGAIGFATSRSLHHKSRSGEYIPTLKADEAELMGIALGLRDGGGGVLELASDWPPDVRDEEFGMLRRIVKESGCPASFAIVQKSSDPQSWRRMLQLVTEAREDDLPITCQVTPRPMGAIITLQASNSPLRVSDTFSGLADLPRLKLVEALRTPETRERVIAELRAGCDSPLLRQFGSFDLFFPQQGALDYAPKREDSIAERAAREGRDPFELIYDALLRDEGRAFIYWPLSNYLDYNYDAIEEMLAHPYTVPGLGDGGAHVGIICDASFPTYYLSHWGRDRGDRSFDVGWLIKQHTADNAAAVGMTDRGVLAPGMKADINVIDFDRLNLQAPEIVNDLPAGGARIMQRATGYVATIVSGTVVYREGVATGALPGRLVRGKGYTTH
jgi:N-acyl-D-aspartate/D-glutamate deacylase